MVTLQRQIMRESPPQKKKKKKKKVYPIGQAVCVYFY